MRKLIICLVLLIYTAAVILLTQRHTVDLLAGKVTLWQVALGGEEYQRGFEMMNKLATDTIKDHKWPNGRHVNFTGKMSGWGVWR